MKSKPNTKKVDNILRDRHIFVVMRLLYLVICFRSLILPIHQPVIQPWVTFVNEYFMESIFRMEKIHSMFFIPFTNTLLYFHGVDGKVECTKQRKED